MKRTLTTLAILGFSLMAGAGFAATQSTTPSNPPKHTISAARKEALAECKKEGMVGKKLNACVKEHLSKSEPTKNPAS
jgi:hypothetical protein